MKRLLLWLFTPIPSMANAMRNLRDGWGNVRFVSRTLKTDLKDARQPPTSETWAEAIARERPTALRIRKQVAYRQVTTFALVLIAGFSIYAAVADNALIPGAAGFCISGIWYFGQALRLYQIRHHTLCPARHYLAHAVRSPAEFLPIGIPSTWTPLPNKSIGGHHADPE